MVIAMVTVPASAAAFRRPRSALKLFEIVQVVRDFGRVERLFGVALALTIAAPAQAGERRRDAEWAPARPPVAAPAPVANGSIFQAANGYAPLYLGNRARSVGDPLTILLVERTSASKDVDSQTDREGNIGLTPPATGPLSLFAPSDVRASGSQGFNGGGQASQSNRLSGEVSVTVQEIYPNGTMLVSGQKQLELNRGEEWVRIAGIVRFVDVDAENRVLSTRVADARISYAGRGDFHRSSRPGWLQRFFSFVSPF